jgi:tRNA A-37 threonylcarbamoyl transferase component Bud32
MAVSGIGSVLEGKYEIVELLGSGGMGDVYLARHLHLDETRVVKVLRPEIAADEDSQRRFLREARLATQVKHPNVAILHDCSRLPEGSFYMVWEHVQGRDVASLLADGGPLDLQEAVGLGIQALRGLEAIHSIGVIHRDVSPDNLMVFTSARGDRRLKIIDLGLARALAPDPRYEVTQVGTFMGKLRYCSPEQARMSEGETLDRRTDLYSLGLVLYEMICGLTPFEGAGPAAVFKRVSEDPLPLAGRSPDVDVPAVLDRVVMKALRRERDARYPDAVSFIEALDEAGRALAEASTREIEVVPGVPAAAPPAAPSPAVAAPRDPASASRSGELTREERESLLAQIDRAAQRVREGTLVVNRAQEALDAGRVTEARSLIERLEQVSPGARGLAELRRALDEAERDAGYEQRVADLEQMLLTYVKKKQKPLAQMALESLLDLAPTHKRRGDYESWVALLDQEVEQDARARDALAAGREALAAGDERKVRRQLDLLRKLEPETAQRFALEVDAARAEAEAGAEVERRRERFEAHLASGDFDQAARQLDALRGKVSRLTLDGYRERIEAERRRGEQRRGEAEADKMFRQRVESRDWSGAREVASALGERFPESERPRAMYEEVGRLDAAGRRVAAIRDGERQIDQLIAKGDADQARLALRVLLQMDPDNARRHKLEKQIEALGK